MSDELFACVVCGDLAGLERAIASGANVDARDGYGWTPLCWAAGRGDTASVKKLLEHGADVFARGNDGRTPYSIAAAASKVEAARALAAAEDAAGGDTEQTSSRRHLTRPYCKAYPASRLRLFEHWTEAAPPSPEKLPGHLDATLLGAIQDDDCLFLHRELVVTRSVYVDELVVFDGVAPGWSEFCHEVLDFNPPDDFTWMNGVGS